MIDKEKTRQIKHDLLSISSDIKSVVDCVLDNYENKELSFELLKALESKSNAHHQLVLKVFNGIGQTGGL